MAKVPIIHNPSGIVEDARNLLVEPGDVASHLTHGDTEGSLEEEHRKFRDLFIPEGLRFEYNDLQQLDTIYTKIVNLFEDVLNGNVLLNTDLDSEFMQDINRVYTYWDTLREGFQQKVRTLLDPFDLTSLITRNDQIVGNLLTSIADVYSFKGTGRSFKYALNIVGMDAKIVKGYEPEYLDYREANELCAAVIVVSVGDNPISEESALAFERLVELLLDMCLKVRAWIYVKTLTDDIASFDTVLVNRIGQSLIDDYDRIRSILQLEAPYGLRSGVGETEESRGYPIMYRGDVSGPVTGKRLGAFMDYTVGGRLFRIPTGDTDPFTSRFKHTLSERAIHSSPTHNGDYKRNQGLTRGGSDIEGLYLRDFASQRIKYSLEDTITITEVFSIS